MDSYFLRRQFKLEEKNTNVKTEIIAGITTFMTMAYILTVNPSILSEGGMDWGPAFTATGLTAAISTGLMGLLANFPMGLASGMGINAFFAYSLATVYGWQFAVTVVLGEAILLLALSASNASQLVLDAIPGILKSAMSVGIGFFISFVGLSNAGLIETGGPTILAMGDLRSPSLLLAIIGLLISGFLLVKNVPGAFLIGIIVTTLLGIPMGVTQIPDGGLKIFSLPPSPGPHMLAFDFSVIFSVDYLVSVLTLLFMDLSNTIGTMSAMARQTGEIDQDGRVTFARKGLLADALGTLFCAIFGNASTTSYAESATGIAQGGRSGLTSLTIAAMFIIALFLSPLFAMIPPAATSPALVYVGLFMLSSIKDIDFSSDYTEAIPAFFTIIIMPFSYSIADGISWGVISYVILKVLDGKAKEVSPVMFVIGLLFLLKEIFI